MFKGSANYLVFQCTQTCALRRTKVQGIGAQNTLISFPKASESIVDWPVRSFTDMCL